MDVKAIEIRDRMTLIPAIAIRRSTLDTDAGDRLMAAAGYGGRFPSIILVTLSDAQASNDPYRWDRSSRTMEEAHRYLENTWDNLGDFAVVDVQFILGETAAPKDSEVRRAPPA